MKHFLYLFFTFLFFSTQAQDEFSCHHYDEAGRTRERTVDFESMVLHVDFDTKEQKVFGNVKYEFSPIRKAVSTLVLDAPGITISEVLLNGNKCAFTTTATDLEIDFNESLAWETNHSLEITYEAQPEKGLYFLGWNDPTQRARKQIWTQGQGIDNRFWIPSFDDVSDKLITETYITFQNGFEVISNGDLIEKIDVANNKTTWHYKMQKPHVMYLVMIAIGDYAYHDYVSKRGIVSRQYYYPESPEDLTPTYQYSAEMMDWMENEFGINYPWGKIYRNVPVADFMYGAMENTTSTILTDYYLQNSREALERNYIGTNAHELTHQWFGDYITEWNGASHWLHESFATQYAKHFKQTVIGEDDYQWDRFQEMRRAMSADDKNDLPVAHSKAGSSRHYPKGSIVIDMLRIAAGGEEQYQKVITNYLKKYGFKHVDTHLFQMEFMETLGLNLDWFFDQWIYRGGYPHYEVSYETLEDSITINVNQIQEFNATIGVFKANIPCRIFYKDGTTKAVNLNIESDTSAYTFGNDKEVEFLMFDEGNTVYKQLTFKRSPDELLAQAKKATNMIDRYFALKDLEDIDIELKRDAFIEIYNQESFYATKGNIVKQLANDNNKKSQKLIKLALQDLDFSVRRAALNFVDEIDKKQLALFELALKDSSFVNIDMALKKLSEQFPENRTKYLDITSKDALLNPSLYLTWLKLDYENGNPESKAKLIDFAGESFEFRTRLKAISICKGFEFSDKQLIANLLNACVSFNGRLARDGKNYLSELALDENIKNEILKQIENSNFDKNMLKRLAALLDEIKE